MQVLHPKKLAGSRWVSSTEKKNGYKPELGQIKFFSRAPLWHIFTSLYVIYLSNGLHLWEHSISFLPICLFIYLFIGLFVCLWCSIWSWCWITDSLLFLSLFCMWWYTLSHTTLPLLLNWLHRKVLCVGQRRPFSGGYKHMAADTVNRDVGSLNLLLKT